MKILVAVLMTALIVFAGATAWVDYVQPNLELIARATQQKSTSEPAPTAKKRSRSAHVEYDDDLLQVPEDGLADSEKPARRSPSRGRVPLPRDEEVSSQLKEQLDEVKTRESRVSARQEALRMMYDDIRSELAMLDDIRKRTSDELASAERGRIDNDRRRNATRRVADVPARERASLPAVPIALKNMTGDSAARTQALVMIQLAKEGKLETAISLLKAMKGREAAGILDSVSSVAPGLADRLADSVRVIDDRPVRR